jgi:phage terminase large subunit-like protein
MQVEARLQSAPRTLPTKTTRSRDTASIDDPTTRYAEAVAHGRIVAGPHVRAQCKRHLRDLLDGHERSLSFDLARAEYALKFFPTVLKLNGGQFENNPFILEPAQEFIIGSLFGWVRADGTRRFRVAYIEEGKGNGKSPLVAGIGLIGLVADKEPRAEVYAAATKKDQAMILFRDAVAMVDQSPSLKKRLKQSGRDDKVWNLYDDRSNSFFRPISADDGQSGPRPHIGLVDELHEHKTATMMNMMAAGQKFRRQPLLVAITNSGTDRKSVCWEYREKGIRVAAGIDQDDTLFPYICALDEGEDPFENESCWVKANPLLGTVITEEYLRNQVNGARGMPSKESTVRRLNFCQWVEAHNPAIPYELWVAAKAEYTLEKFRGMKCVAGIDLSATTDLTAVVLIFEKDGCFWLWPMFWIPQDGLSDRVKRDHVPYDLWVKKGYVYTTPGAAIDKDFVVEKVGKVIGEYDITISKAPYDRHRIDVLTAACNRIGVKWPLEPFGQGFVSMSPAWEAFETALVSKTLRHPDNPCMNVNAANAVVIQDPAGNKKLDKSKATGRIDGAVAATMALGVIAATSKAAPKYQAFFV